MQTKFGLIEQNRRRRIGLEESYRKADEAERAIGKLISAEWVL